MSGQPFVSALSICGPAIGRAVGYAEIDEVFGGGDNPRNDFRPRFNQYGESSREILSAKENRPASEKPGFRQLPPSPPPKFAYPQQQQQLPQTVPKTTKKTGGTVVPQKPPFLTGKAPIRNNLEKLPAVPKPSTATGGTVDNRAEIAELKRQIGELSHLLRLHVDPKVTTRDFGTDPIVFESTTTDAATNTEPMKFCSGCKKTMNSDTSSPVPSIEDDSPPEHNTSLCSQLESLAMQYLSDDQLANIAHGNRTAAGAVAVKKISSNPKKNRQDFDPRRQRQEQLQVVERSPPRRRMAASATTLESNMISPNFGSGGGLTLTRRHCVMTMEQEVSVFGGPSKRNGSEALPFSVASQDFMQRHGVLKNSSSRQQYRQTRNYDPDPEDNYAQYYHHPDRRADNRRRQPQYDSTVGPPRYYNSRQYRDAPESDFDDQWD